MLAYKTPKVKRFDTDAIGFAVVESAYKRVHKVEPLTLQKNYT